MPFFPQDTNIMVDQAIQRFIQTTNIDNFGPGSKIRSLLEVLYNDIGRLQTDFYANQTIGFVSGATGSYLDFMASLFGISRVRANRVTIGSNTNNFKIFTTAANFGAINSNRSIYIPAGTVISSSTSDASYSLTDNINLSAGSSSVYVNATSNSNGTVANLGQGALDTIDFTNYTDSANGSLLVSNTFPVDVGTNEETDPEFRFRIIETLKSYQKGNELALRVKALTIPGIVDMVYEDKAYGIGTARVILQTSTAIVDDNVLDYAESILQQEVPIGTLLSVEKPDTVQIALKVTINFRVGVTTTQRTTTISNVTTRINEYINSIPINQPLLINRLASEILAVDSMNILSIGIPNKFFDYIYTYRTTKIGLVRTEVFDDIYIPAGLAYKFITATFIDQSIVVS